VNFLEYKQFYLSRGLLPLEKILNSKAKIKCVDKEGYSYALTVSSVKDMRTKDFGKFVKTNPFKAQNMRLYVSRVEPNSEILSTDEELVEATNKRIWFKCPICGKPFDKKWCHWLGMKENEHTCQECSKKRRANGQVYTYEQLKSIYEQNGFKLLSKYEEYLNNGRSHARLSCKDGEGYLYCVNVTNFQQIFSGKNKFSTNNPYAKENLTKYLNDNNIEVEIVELNQSKKKSIFKCSCGREFQTTINALLSENKTRCSKCVSKESKYSLMTRKWLEDNKIPYETEYRFKDCRYKYPLPFDFKVNWRNKTVLIEVDGGQHYYTTQWTDQKDLEGIKIRDKIKTKYCKENGYILLRIPYWLYKTDSYKNKLNTTFSA